MPDIKEAELKWKDLMNQKATKIVNRRQTDVKDQSLECSIGRYRYFSFNLLVNMCLSRHFES